MLRAEIKAETDNVKREVNKTLSANSFTIETGAFRKQEELKETLFAEVKRPAQFLHYENT